MAPLVVGVPKEIKDSENRVAVQPDGVAELVYHGHRVLVETEAGTGSRFSDADTPPLVPRSSIQPTRFSPPPT